MNKYQRRKLLHRRRVLGETLAMLDGERLRFGKLHKETQYPLETQSERGEGHIDGLMAAVVMVIEEYNKVDKLLKNKKKVLATKGGGQ